MATSLVANERLVREALQSLEALYPGLTIEDVETVFRRATSDSPLQEAIEVVGTLVFQEDMPKHVPELVEKLLGVEIPDSMDGLVTIIVMGIVAYGIYWAAAKLGKKDAVSGLAIQGNYNQIIHTGSFVLNVAPGALEEAIEGRFQKARAGVLARKALEFIRPAQREEGAAIEGGGLRIYPETIAAAPTLLDAELAEDEESQDPYTGQQIVVHATDLDSNKTGWAGHLPGIWEKRLPMRLYPTINPEDIFGKREIVGDVIVVSRRNADGEYVPYIFHVVGLD